MEFEGALTAIAEIAAVFVGFAALVTAIGAQREAAELDRQRLRFVIIAGLGTAISALVPIAIYAFGVDPLTSWRLSGLFNLACNWVGGLFVLRLGARVRREFIRENPIVIALIHVLEIGVQAALIALVLGFGKEVAPALFLTALVAGLAQASLAFLALAESLFSDRGDSAA